MYKDYQMSIIDKYEVDKHRQFIPVQICNAPTSQHYINKYYDYYY